MVRTLRFLSFVMLLMVATFASAKDYVLVEGNNKIEAYTSMNATFTADKDCKVLIEAGEAYDKVEYAGVVYQHKYSGGMYHYEIDDVKAGGVVTLTHGFIMSGGNLKVTVKAIGEVIPVEVKAVSPAEGSTFSWATTGMVSVNFNKDVVFSSVQMRVGNTFLDVDGATVTGSNVGVNISKVLNKVLNNGMLNPGGVFGIVFSGLRDAEDDTNLYKGNGEFALRFIAPHPQHSFVQATVNDTKLSYFESNSYTFLSYYPTDGTDGVFEVEFDGDVKSLTSVRFTMGNLDLSGMGKYHVSSLPYTIEGNKVIIDARGTLRTIAVLFPAIVEEDTSEGEGEGVSEALGTFDTEHATITLSNVVDTNGNVFATNLPGSVGSFSFVLNYKEIIDNVNIEGDNKFDGEDVVPGEEIRVWVSNENLKFDGISVSYTVEVANPDEIADPENEASAVYEKKEIVVKDFTIEPDEFEGIIITFVMPEMPDAVIGKNVRVSLHNASTADGMPHSLYMDFIAAKPLNDAIVGTGETQRNAKVYSLGGMRVNEKAATHGIFIKNGVKVLK